MLRGLDHDNIIKAYELIPIVSDFRILLRTDQLEEFDAINGGSIHVEKIDEDTYILEPRVALVLEWCEYGELFGVVVKNGGIKDMDLLEFLAC